MSRFFFVESSTALTNFLVIRAVVYNTRGGLQYEIGAVAGACDVINGLVVGFGVINDTTRVW